MKAGIINVTGYAGIELARLLHRHPEVEIAGVTGRSQAGERLGDALPHLERLGLTIEPDIAASVDVVFSALPQVASADVCAKYARGGVKVVDISADFRLRDPAEYAAWYGAEHPAPDLLETSVYGLTELDREGIAAARLVANPGCYPTAALLALAPVVRAGLITEQVVVDCKSGVSGAGRGLSLTTHFSEVNENVFAYGVGGHRHLPEITQELRRMRGGYEPSVLFQPHLIPMTRGILDTVYGGFRGRRVRLAAGRLPRRYGTLPRILPRRAVREGRGQASADQADLGEQRLLGVSYGGRADGQTRRLLRAGQPRQGRGGAGRAEYESDVRPAGDDGAGATGRLPVARAPIV